MPWREAKARPAVALKASPARPCAVDAAAAAVLSLLFHAYVGWRLVPALGSIAGASVLALLLVVSALTMPLGLGARARRRAASRRRLGLGRPDRDGLVLVDVRADPRARRRLLAALAVDSVRPGVDRHVARYAVDQRPRRRRRRRRWSRSGASPTRAARPASAASTCPSPACAPALDGFTIAQISDVHVGPTIKRPYVEAIVATVNRLDADLVAVTGDLVDGSVAQLAEHVAPLAGLRSKEGSFFVTGNHEYYSGAARLGARAAPARPRRADERARRRATAATPRSSSPASPTSAPATSTAPRRAIRARRWPAARRRRSGCCSRTSRAAPTRPRRPASTSSCPATPTAASSGPGTSSSACSSRSRPGCTAGAASGSTPAGAPATGGRRSASARRRR